MPSPRLIFKAILATRLSWLTCRATYLPTPKRDSFLAQDHVFTIHSRMAPHERSRIAFLHGTTPWPTIN